MQKANVVTVSKLARSPFRSEFHLPISGPVAYDENVVEFGGETLYIRDFSTGLNGLVKAIIVRKTDEPYFYAWKLYMDEPTKPGVTLAEINNLALRHIQCRESSEHRNQKELAWVNSGWEEKRWSLPRFLQEALLRNFRTDWEERRGGCMCYPKQSWQLRLVWLTGQELAALESVVQLKVKQFDMEELLRLDWHRCDLTELAFKECIIDAFHAPPTVSDERVHHLQEVVDGIRASYVRRR